MSGLLQPMARRRRIVVRLGAWLAILALLIQNGLPLADAAFHAALAMGDEGGITAASAQTDTGNAIAAVSKQSPAHLAHDCPICEFITALGSFTPPTVTHAAAPLSIDRFAIWPTAPPRVRSADRSNAQPRAPPALI
jgi:hypothetical protein